MKDNKKSVGYIIGTVLSAVLIACLAACIGSVAVALTAKFIMWLF